MVEFTTAELWTKTLAERSADPDQAMREKLRSAYTSMRDAAGVLGDEIARTLPSYPAHDLVHSDAFWHLGGQILGPTNPLSPLEAFVFGAASLIHDLGMGLAAYPGGELELRSDARWRDAIAVRLRKTLSRAPTEDEIMSPPSPIAATVREELLRAMHAEKARDLANASWVDPSTGQRLYLLEDADLRLTFGELVGRIAASHHWDLDELIREFRQPLGTWPGFPASWGVDPLKLACLLRVTDAAQLDARRTERLRRAVRDITGVSATHWAFQEKLLEPTVLDDRLYYTSAVAFQRSEAEAWWLCFDMLRGVVDVELRGVDALLADSGRSRFCVRSVAGVESPHRLADLIRTEGWEPVDSRIHVSSVSSLVTKLGGEELYGRRPLVAVRELIQNASDAVRARRFVEQLPDAWGDVFVRIGTDHVGQWVEVEDTGIGMSEQVLTGPLLDFGVSYWGSELARAEHLGLMSSSFEPEGRYGIGFFAVFMVGGRVIVRSRRAEAGWDETKVLEFPNGVESRPMLRPADPAEVLRHGGTSVRVYLRDDLDIFWSDGEFPDSAQGDPRATLAQMAPSIAVNLWYQSGDEPQELCVGANDWRTLSGSDLIRRLWGVTDFSELGVNPELAAAVAANLRPIEDDRGAVVGRAAVWRGGIYPDGRFPSMLGVVTCGGLAAGTFLDIQGLLVGQPSRAARDSARPYATGDGLARWATEQAGLVAGLPGREMLWSMWDASVIRACGGETGGLPLGFTSAGWLSAEALESWISQLDMIEFAGLYEPYGSRRVEQYQFVPREGVLMTDPLRATLIREAPDYLLRPGTGWPPSIRSAMANADEDGGAGRRWAFVADSLCGAVVEIAASVWRTSRMALMEESDSHWWDDELPPQEVIGRDIQGDVEGRVSLRIRRPSRR